MVQEMYPNLLLICIFLPILYGNKQKDGVG